MMMPENLTMDDFSIDAGKEGTIAVFKWKGSLHFPSPEDFLDPYFENILVWAQKERLSIKFDFVSLDYMNSASIPPLIQFLRRLAELEINGEFVYDSKRKVQTASFRALDVSAKKSKFTTVKGM